MVAAKWEMTLVTALAWAGMAWGQKPCPSCPKAVENPCCVTIQELGQPPEQCRVVKRWCEPNGLVAYEVETLATGERLTIVGNEPICTSTGTKPGQVIQAMATRIYHWKNPTTPPPGAPLPSAAARVTLPSGYPGASVEEVKGKPYPPRLVSVQEMLRPAARETRLEQYPSERSGSGNSSIAAVKSATKEVTTSARSDGFSPTGVRIISAKGYPSSPAPKSAAAAAGVAWPVSGIDSKTSANPTQKVAQTNLEQKSSLATVERIRKTESTMPLKAPQTKAKDTAQEIKMAKAVTERPQPSDWHQSWGKADDHQSRMPPQQNLPQAAHATQDPLKDPESFSPAILAEKKGVEGVAASKEEKALASKEEKPQPPPSAPLVKEEQPKKEETPAPALAKVETGTVTAPNEKPAPATAKVTEAAPEKKEEKPQAKESTAEKATPVKPAQKTAQARKAPPAPRKAPEPRAAEAKAETPSTGIGGAFKRLFAKGTSPESKENSAAPDAAPKKDDGVQHGSQSVLAAYVPVPIMTMPQPRTVPPSPPPVLPAPPRSLPPQATPAPVPRQLVTPVSPGEANAFSAPNSSGEAANAFTPPAENVSPGQATVMNYQGCPGAYPAAAPANPAAPGVNRYGPMRQAAMPVSYPPPVQRQEMVAMAQPPMRQPYSTPAAVLPNHTSDRGPVTPAGYQAPGMANTDVSQLLLMLRSSLYPSSREWAADRLAGLDWHTNPVVLEALAQAAREDPAATVRAGCIRSLAKMKASTPSVLEALKTLKADEDPVVRQLAQETLARFEKP